MCVQPSSCDELICDDLQQCLELPANLSGRSGPGLSPVCLPIFGRNCDDTVCPDGTICTLTSITNKNFSLSQCIDPEQIILPSLPPTCDSIDCGEGSVCVDLRAGSTPVMGSCISTGCTNSTGCDPGSTCTSIPAEFGLNFSSVCTPITVDAQVGTETCAESGRDCSAPFVCQEAFIDGTLVGTACSTPPRVALSCEDARCTEQGVDCIVLSAPSVGSFAVCSSDVDNIIMLYNELFEILGL